MRGIKSASGAQELTGRDIIVGVNGAGKTTRIQALGISLLGYAPGGGKLLSETMKMANGDSMKVGVETDGFTVVREFTRNGAKIEQDICLLPPNSKKQGDKVADKERRIQQELGAFPVTLDFGEFLSLSDAKRREFIYGLAAGGDDGADSADKADEALRGRLRLPETADPAEIEALEADIAECLGQYPAGAGLQEGLQAMLDYAKEQTSYWKKERDTSIGASQKIAEYKNDLAETDRNLNANNNRLDELHKSITNVAADLAVARAENLRIDAANKRMDALEEEVRGIEVETNAGNVIKLRNAIAQYSMEIRNVDNSAAIAAALESINQGRGLLGGLEKGVEALRDEYQFFKVRKAANETLLEQIKKQGGKCPIDCRIECDKDFSDLIGSLTLAISADCDTLKEIAQRGADANAGLAEARQGVDDAQLAIDALRQEEVDALRENEQIHVIVRDLQAEIAATESFDATKEARLKAKREELLGLRPETGEQRWQRMNTEALEEILGQLEGEAEALKAKVAEQVKARNALASLQSSMVDSVIAGYHADAWKNIAEAVGPKGLQGELVKDALAPLTAAVQAKLDQMGASGRAFYFQTTDSKGKEIFQFGWTGPDGFRRNFDALSTGEQLLLLIALMTTIIERLDPPLKVLCIDNAENLDGGNLKRVLNGLAKAGESLDNIIFCGVIRLSPADFPGWRVWELGGAE